MGTPPKAPLPITGKKSSMGKDPAAEYGKGPSNRLGSNNLESQVSTSLSSMRSDPLACYHNKY